ncbi:SWI/SNF complex subunit SWI3D isoform X2 [Prosopis cineraria]|uniref:SWI/SNF complex subunit SWI3D isoform X2 n=1 Tax=Prosopis cineraria TaxID=364024 RepID=UPI00240F3F6C|nr:SWI/SNF complex subunit SWI3D isoform X2 [Prosopis cineraria]
MEEKHREAAVQPSSNVDSPASESASSRRRSGGLKRKGNTLGASNSTPAPSKRVTREKALPAHPSPVHNGPLTRARQIPSNHATTAASALLAGGGGLAADYSRHSERAVTSEALGRESAAFAEDIKKESEWEALEAAIETEFEAVRSRGANAHVVPSHCGWFLWTDIHPIEKNALPSFFNGKTEHRTPDIYMEIRNWIMKKFHAKPNAQIELKDLSELDVGGLDARQEVMEFLDHWGLINFHPFPSMDNALVSTDDDGATEKQSLVEKLYHFETVQLCPHVIPKTNLMTQDMPSGLFPESTFVEELVKQEGPAVEYHCNSCSADCSRKRYHCQKQADFDLCSDCFSNGKFGSGMSSTDFILMEPAEVQGVSGGKWTDQETLLLLEALELYKENWNEIAEHVATKTKAQCILHFVQMPIEEAFVDSDVVDANCKETADPAATKNDSSTVKDASETLEHKTSNSDGQVLTPCDQTSKGEDANKVKSGQETLMPENGSNEKISEGTCRLENAAEVKLGQEAGDNFVLKALGEAFEAIGYSSGPEGPSSFAEVGNPVMALGGFLARLVGSDMAVASAHSSLKSISSNSPSIELAARHCFLLEDPPDEKKGPSSFERDSIMDVDQDEGEKQDQSLLTAKDVSNDPRIIANDALEDKRQLTSTDGGASEEPVALKEQVLANHEEIVLDNCKNPANSKLFSDCTVQYSDGSTSNAEGTSIKELCQPAEKMKGECVVSDCLRSEKNELEQSIMSSKAGEKPKSEQAPTGMEALSDSLPLDKSKPQKPLSRNPVGDCMETTELLTNVDVVSNSLPSENESEPQVTLDLYQHTGTAKDVDMTSLDQNEHSHPVTSRSGAENGKSTGEDHTENGRKMVDNNINTKQENKFEKLKRAAISTLAAAAVKAKLLANQEEDQIRQLATLLIEKQVHKLETKLAFFNDMDNVVMRVREHLDRSRQKLYHERAMIIASRLGIPPSSRGVPPSLPTNRIPMNFVNSAPRPPINMNPQRLPISRSMGNVATTLSNSLSSPATGNSVLPSSQENLSSVETK